MPEDDKLFQRPIMTPEQIMVEQAENRIRGLMRDPTAMPELSAFATTMINLQNQISAMQGPMSNIGKIVDGVSIPAVVLTGYFPVIKKATVASGNAVFQFTEDNTAGGAALFATGPLANSEMFRAEEGANPHAFGLAAWSNGNKTLTVPVSRTGNAVTVALLGLTLLQQNVAANGSVIYAIAWGK